MVLAELGGKAVAGPYARGRAERVLQAGMLSDQSSYPCPGRERKQPFDETRADKCASAETLAPTVVANGLDRRDQCGHFGSGEKCCNVTNCRATRYFARCH